EPVDEVPERLGAGAVVDEPVEGREEREALGNRAVLGLWVGDEPPTLQPHADRAEALLVVEPSRLCERQGLGLGVPALGEIPDALLALSADDRDLAASGEELQHQAHLALAPPAVVLTPVAGRI